MARPVPASHAEKASIRIGTRANDGVWFSTYPYTDEDLALLVYSLQLTSNL